MAIKYRCPYCNEEEAILYGKFKGYGKLVQRLYCKNCKHSFYFPYRETFFNRMRNSHETFYKALVLYNQGYPVSEIAQKLQKRPNTIIKWIRKVYAEPLTFKHILKNELGKSEKETIDFFIDLREAARTRKSSLPYNELVSEINTIIRHFQKVITPTDYGLTKQQGVKSGKDFFIAQLDKQWNQR